MRDLRPAEVAARLAKLAALYVPDTIDEGRARLRADRMAPAAFAADVANRLEELRALDELTQYLHAPSRATR
jgi:hypothetical protein